jgi:phage terminase large subunit-like protein
MQNTQTALKYAHDIKTGTIPSNDYVKLAVNRFFNDLERTDWDFEFSEETADYYLRFFDLLKLTKGVGAGFKFKLEPWQCFIIANTFGWLSKTSGKRRFKEVYIEIPKKNGKTTLAAAVGLIGLFWDDEPRPDIYAAAYTKDQAKICLIEAINLANSHPNLKGRIKKLLNNMEHIGNGGVFEAVSNEAKNTEGKNAHIVLFDEYHVHKNDDTKSSLRSGMASREQPLFFTITTAGDNRLSPCYIYRTQCINILQGHVERENVFTIIYGLDDNDDWNDPANWEKANPNWGVSVQPDFLRTEYEGALQSGRAEVEFKTKHLNKWVDSAATWIPNELWKKGVVDDLYAQIPNNATCYGGLDLASTSDITALSLYFPPQSGIEKGFFKRFFFVPEEAVKNSRKSGVDYHNWVAKGYMIQTEGKRLNYDVVQTIIEELNEKFDLQFVAVDRWNASQLIQDLNEKIDKRFVNNKWEDFIHEYGQGYKDMSTPAKEYEMIYIEENIWHDGNPVHAWMLGNVALSTDPAGNIKPDKAKSSNKIDGVVSDVMAYGTYLTFYTEDTLTPSCY